MAIDWDKPLQTKEGRSARLLGELEHPRYRHVVAVNVGGVESVRTYKANGQYLPHSSSEEDLQNVSEPQPLTDEEMNQLVFRRCALCKRDLDGMVAAVTDAKTISGERFAYVGESWYSAEELLEDWRWEDGSKIVSGSVEAHS